MYKDLFNHFYGNNLLTKNQSGFTPGDSCIFQLLSFVHEINSFLDCNPTTEIKNMLPDTSKAFDKVKPESCGTGSEHVEHLQGLSISAKRE